MSYPRNTFLRYFPSTFGLADHFTARVLRDGKIFQVKPQKQSFDSVATWLAALPGQPTAADLRVEESIYAAYDASWNIHTEVMKDHYVYRHTISWPAYLYKVIMKYNANLKQNAELREAFYNLMDVLDQVKDKATIFVYYEMAMKNYQYVLMEPSEKEPWTALPAPFHCRYGAYNYNPMHISQKKEIAPQVYEAYKPLYDLMEKHGVLAWIRASSEEQKKKSLAKLEARAIRCKERQAVKEKKRKQKLLYRQLTRLERSLYQVQNKMLTLQSQEKYLQSLILSVKGEMVKLPAIDPYMRL